MKYNTPEMETVQLEVADIITTSFDEEDYGDGTGELVVTPPYSWAE